MDKPTDQELVLRTLQAEREVGFTQHTHLAMYNKPAYRHKNGSEYLVMMIALREEDLVPLVIYHGTGGVIFARPLSEFLDGRFTRIN